jgi:uncharacterized protein
MGESQIKELIEVVVRALVDHPEQIVVNEISGRQMSVIELRTAKEDMGKIIGKEGRNADALRTLANAVAAKLKKRVVIEILG